MPLEEIRLPFAGDHWWYPRRTYWRVWAEFDRARSELVGAQETPRAQRFTWRMTSDEQVPPRVTPTRFGGE